MSLSDTLHHGNTQCFKLSKMSGCIQVANMRLMVLYVIKDSEGFLAELNDRFLETLVVL